MSVVGIIPARLHSSRLPRKLLLSETGRPLLQYSWEAACRAARLSRVCIAADCQEIASVARGFGADCELTGEHPSGTDRVAEVVRRCDESVEIVVNIQGDEPELDPRHIDQLVHLLTENPAAEMATLATPIRSLAQLEDPSCTKVVRSLDGRALYFSRAAVPFSRDQAPATLLATDSPYLLHLGIYAYRRAFLTRMTSAPPSPLEQLEKLEQLRALELGAVLLVGLVAHPAVGIDTPEDYAAFVARCRRTDDV